MTLLIMTILIMTILIMTLLIMTILAILNMGDLTNRSMTLCIRGLFVTLSIIDSQHSIVMCVVMLSVAFYFLLF